MKARVRLLGLMLAGVAACHGGDPARTHVLGPLGNYVSDSAPSRSKAYLGGVNVWAYCESLGFPTVGYRRGYIRGPRAAYANWVCQTGSNQLAPVHPRPVDMVKACEWQFPGDSVVARPSDPDHAWSWDCYRRET